MKKSTLFNVLRVIAYGFPFLIIYYLNKMISIHRNMQIDSNFWLDASIITLLIVVMISLFKISKTRSSLNIKKRLKVLITIIYVLTFTLFSIYNIQDQLIFHPNSSNNNYARVIHLGYTPISIDNEYYGLAKFNSEEKLQTVIYFGGNGENTATNFYNFDSNNIFDIYENYNFISFDYPSYGFSKGIATEDAIYLMADKITEYIKHHPFIDEDNITVIGFSIGSGVASYFANNHPVKRLVLLAPYNNLTSAMNSFLPIFYGPLKHLVKHKFPSDTYLLNHDFDILIIYSKADQVIKSKLTKTLIDSISTDSSNVSYFELPYATHNEVPYQLETQFLISGFLNVE